MQRSNKLKKLKWRVQAAKVKDKRAEGKQVKSKSKKILSSNRPLELLHVDLFELVQTASLSEKKYTLVVVDDSTRFIWVTFLSIKDETQKMLNELLVRIQNEKGQSVVNIRSYKRTKFTCSEVEKYYNE